MAAFAGRALLFGVLGAVVAACGGGAAQSSVRTLPSPSQPADVSQLWEAVAIESRDLRHGPGGMALAPKPDAAYTFVSRDETGYSKGFDVTAPDGTPWAVKLGPEAQTEVVSSRLFWAVGYHQPAVYYLPRWTLTGQQAGTQPEGRFRREPVTETVVGDWSWYENPFVGSQAFKGLIVANLLVNNWDWKTTNNKIVEIRDGGSARRVYMVRDIGASLGKTTYSRWVTWIRGFGKGTRNDLPGFESQRLIKRVEGERVVFDYRGLHGSLIETVSVPDVLWTCRLFARLSDRQLHDAFGAAGYDGDQRDRYVTKLKAKIAEGLALAR